ncbi:2-polyprenyl-3-methyl-5-hydroxy-6-metoxy-1,4-benzoquinol methylase [Algoriphagus sp. 4150]|uniref:class I SAM-dependent methyltransferase n=1 Tax=Algoriphagus sp. 4150 TaxID=2817756 RepID=UPI002865BBF3|nr:class I SAM-dependent methyltransferase [Algoriphagus sp. 4150]MDR7128483.1 2-polyprenyl-3-methyl-5-hydroxy-6-metoxy-1,4-benzoquinol methylase [Algoriphagus sp. 4150]
MEDKMLERLTKCPLCKSGLFLNYQEIKDFAVSQKSFILCNCTNCGLKFTNPRPKQDTIAPYYDFPEYFSHDDKAKNLTQLAYQKVRKYNISQKLKYLTSLKPRKGNYLDFGCGTAELLAHAHTRGWKVTGIEPNEKARKLANSKISGKVYESINELPKGSSFDIITLYHVLEHVHLLRKTVKKLIKHLKSSGYILIAVPNPESHDAIKYGEHWAGWDVPRHLYHFNLQAIENFAEIFDLQLKEILPMTFDSYYVSLLSEGYANPKQSIVKKYWKAILSGKKSNKEAAKAAGNYSSNLFVFKKK